MKLPFALLIAIAIVSPAAAQPQKARPRAPAKVAAPPTAPILPSAETARVAAWVAASADNRTLPYAIIDKRNAALFLFDANGTQVDAVPVLIGIAEGDEATPGVGSKKLSDLGPAEKTTPAGRYLAKFGLPVAGQRVLWVDYATSVALHPIPADASAKEKRRDRMLSETPDDNRITFGCINVPRAFYSGKLRPAFRAKGGYVYILPDTRPIEAVFPRLRASAPGAVTG
jgi:hypothetical protein